MKYHKLPVPKGAHLQYRGVDYDRNTQFLFAFRGYSRVVVVTLPPEDISATVYKIVTQTMLFDFWRNRGAA